MYLVIVNRPYYPSVQKFDNVSDATEAYHEAIKEIQDTGEHEIEVFFADSFASIKGRCDY